MNRKLPHDAFAYYVGLGPDRSYQAVANHFSVDKKTVTRRAAVEDWQGRLAKVEAEARSRTEEHLIENLESVNRRHLQTLRVIQGKALDALKRLPLSSAMDAVRSLDLAIKQERVIRGEPSERTAVSIEDTIKREYRRWMTDQIDDDEDGPGDDLRGAAEEDCA